MDDDRPDEEFRAPVPPARTYLDEVVQWERDAGIHDRNNHALRVKWVNTLREIVSRTAPVNKIGQPLVSDVDLLCATAEQRLEAYRKVCQSAKA